MYLVIGWHLLCRNTIRNTDMCSYIHHILFRFLHRERECNEEPAFHLLCVNFDIKFATVDHLLYLRNNALCSSIYFITIQIYKCVLKYHFGREMGNSIMFSNSSYSQRIKHLNTLALLKFVKNFLVNFKTWEELEDKQCGEYS